MLASAVYTEKKAMLVNKGLARKMTAAFLTSYKSIGHPRRIDAGRIISW